jgi:Uma2 family endonuclease
VTLEATPGAPPDHTQLPDKDGAIVENSQEQPQSTLLTGSMQPRLQQLHPDGQYCIGCDSGIYWKYTTPPLNGCKAPDWFYVPDVPPMLDGQLRRSYVLWKEGVRPLLLIEYVSGDGSEEHDTTPHTGKFWVYEKGIGAAFYAIFDVAKDLVEMFRLEGGVYVPVPPNAAGRLPVPPLGVELGIWHGSYQGMDLPWLRVWDAQTGELLPSTEEREQAERQRAETEKQRAETAESLVEDFRQELADECLRTEEERKRAEAADRRAETAEESLNAVEEKMRRLAEKLRAMGIDPDAT